MTEVVDVAKVARTEFLARPAFATLSSHIGSTQMFFSAEKLLMISSLPSRVSMVPVVGSV